MADTHAKGLTALGKVVSAVALAVSLFAFGLLIAVWVGDMNMLVVYFGFVFALECVAMLCPIRNFPEDEVDHAWCWRKSGHYHYNLIMQFTTVMFLIFVVTCVVLISAVKPVGEDDSVVIPVAVTTSLVLGIVLMAWTGVRKMTYAFAFWLLFAVIMFLDIPLPFAWLNVFGGILSVFVITVILEKIVDCTTKVREIHEHIAIGTGLIFSAYSLFGDWRYWYSRPYRDYMPLFFMGFGAGIVRMFYLFLIEKYWGRDTKLTLGNIDGGFSDDSDDESYDTQLMRPLPTLRDQLAADRDAIDSYD
jgi:hypothetical protein